jgi:hypothetical protein
MKKLYFIFLALLVCACSSAPIPEWKDNAYRHLEDYKKYYLADKEDATEPHFVKARKEIAAGNDLGLLSVAYLTKYALHAASLESFETREFAKLYRLEPNVTNMAYCHFLKGNFSAVDLKALPVQYTGTMKATAGKNIALAAKEIAAIDDPLSRLVACGVWVKYLPYDENIIQIGINTASANGWRRPLWAYLTKLQQYYFERGEASKASAINERLDLLKK